MNLSRRTLGLLMVGSGLILIGLVAQFLVSNWRAEQEAQQPTDFSAIPVAVNYEAPDLTLIDLAGNQQSLAGYRGQIVLVNLWATWCPPCQAEMPILQNYYDKHRPQGFTIVGVEDGEPASDVKSFIWQYGLTFPIWLDPQHLATESAFKTIGLPSSYVIDRQGQVRLSWYGAISEANLEKYLTPLIEER